MANSDTPVLVGWPIAWPPGESFFLQGETPQPHPGVPSGDVADVPGGIPLAPALGLGPIFPSSGVR